MFAFLRRARLGRYLAVSAVVPALVLSTGGAAVAATNTLTVTVLNRSGAKVSASATVVNLATSERFTAHSGKKKKLPKGNYAVLTSVTSGSTTTLGGRTVKVSGSAKLTVDARQGKRVNLAVRPAPAGLFRNLSARICTNTSVVYNVEVYS